LETEDCRKLLIKKQNVKMWTGLNGLGKPSVGGVLWNGSSEVLDFLQTKNILTNNQQ
jgi:hypothetical protein